jgi:UDPglucose 6-dehydrogenase
MNITVVGTGYVGLVTGTCLAALGNQVVCVDVDEAKVVQMRGGKIPIYEPGLEELFLAAIKSKHLTFTTELVDAVQDAEVIFLALPTPPGENGSADLSYILGVADKLGPLLNGYAVVVDKSTVPVGTANQVRERIAKNTQQPFDVVSNPEFLREGLAVQDFTHPDKIVIGTSSKRARKILDRLYAPYLVDGSKMIYMDEASAELTKYANNSFLTMKISFMNEIANVCELVGADVDSVREAIGADSRIGPHFLYAGIGYGGSCFPKDVLALANTASSHGYTFQLLDAVLQVNAQQNGRLQAKVTKYYNDDLQGKTFALWGLAFKPHTDDVREAPAIRIIRDLTARGATIRAFDPEAIAQAKRVLGKLPGLEFASDELAALEGADALLIATEWPQFRAVPPETIKQHLKQPVVFDGRNIFGLQQMRDAGFYYESIGREIVKPN